MTPLKFQHPFSHSSQTIKIKLVCADHLYFTAPLLLCTKQKCPLARKLRIKTWSSLNSPSRVDINMSSDDITNIQRKISDKNISFELVKNLITNTIKSKYLRQQKNLRKSYALYANPWKLMNMKSESKWKLWFAWLGHNASLRKLVEFLALRGKFYCPTVFALLHIVAGAEFRYG